MPLLLLLCLILACLPIDWPEPPFGLGPAGSAALTASVVPACCWSPSSSPSRRCPASPADPGERVAIGRAHSLRRLMFFFLNLAAIWVHADRLRLGLHGQSAAHVDDLLLPGAEVLVLAPYLVTLIGSWAIFFDAERALHRTSPDPSALAGLSGPRWSYVFFLFRLSRTHGFHPGRIHDRSVRHSARLARPV